MPNAVIQTPNQIVDFEKSLDELVDKLREKSYLPPVETGETEE